MQKCNSATQWNKVIPHLHLQILKTLIPTLVLTWIWHLKFIFWHLILVPAHSLRLIKALRVSECSLIYICRWVIHVIGSLKIIVDCVTGGVPSWAGFTGWCEMCWHIVYIGSKPSWLVRSHLSVVPAQSGGLSVIHELSHSTLTLSFNVFSKTE